MTWVSSNAKGKNNPHINLDVCMCFCAKQIERSNFVIEFSSAGNDIDITWAYNDEVERNNDYMRLLKLI